MLTRDQISMFRRFGFCVSQLDLSEAFVTRCIDTAWSLAPDGFQRDRPDTWHGEVTDSCRTKCVYERRGRVKYRECLNGLEWFYDGVARHPGLLSDIASLIGDPLPAKKVRGLYPVYPTKGKKPVPGHCDEHIFQVGAVIYLSDVPLKGGAFKAWPGSHQLMDFQHTCRGGHAPKPTLERMIADINEQIEPVELTGDVGTVIYWHHRLVHGVAINEQKKVRQATLCDFFNADFLRYAHLPTAYAWEHWSSNLRSSANSSQGDAISRAARLLSSRLGGIPTDGPVFQPLHPGPEGRYRSQSRKGSEKQKGMDKVSNRRGPLLYRSMGVWKLDA